MKSFEFITKARIVVAIVAGTLIGSARANMIDGNITFSGGSMLDSSSVNTATEVTGWSSPIVSSSDGDLSSVTAGTPVAFASDWQFNTTSPMVLATIGSGADELTFTLDTSEVVFQQQGFVDVKGAGTLSGDGFDSTPVIWTWSSSDPSAGKAPNAIFSFQAAAAAVPSIATIPEHASTAMLLGGSFLGCATVGRRKSKSK